MTELPPPERRPEPLGFDPKNHRIDRQRASSRSGSDLPATLPPTRSLQANLIGRTVGDRYRIRGTLGEGGMGMVYDAEHIGLGRHVAIKVLNPTQAKKRVAVKRFQQEARAAGAIGHPNICEVYDLGQLDDGSPYLVMEKLVGTTLADRITREGGLPFDELLDAMMQVMSGLIAAHEKGIVHRDIKPENIFLARRSGVPPVVKILDFGVSKMMSQFQGGDEQLDLTRTGMVMGTPYYMSPEQARGERNLDGRVDVYACGVMMYEAILGKRPFLAPNYNALLLAIINSTPRSLREVRPATPPALEAIVVRAMAKARDDRYPSAAAVLRDLQALAIVLGGSSFARSAPNTRVPAPPTAAERMRAPVLGGGLTSPGTLGSQASAGATLRSRMAESQASMAAAPPVAPPREQATRLDIKAKTRPRKADTDSIEIPIHVTGSDLVPVSQPTPPVRRNPQVPSLAGASDYVDEMPTEIFRPGNPAQFMTPPRSSSPSATRPSPRNIPHQRPAAGAPPPQLARPNTDPLPYRVPAPQPTRPAPIDISDLQGDEWDAATIVKKPAALTRPKREAKPFNPDDTIALGDRNPADMNAPLPSTEIEIDFDETQRPPPRRR